MLSSHRWQPWIIMTSLFCCTAGSRIIMETRKCSYGARGSLTVTCVNVNTPTYFKSAGYRFDYLDETLQCINCTLSWIKSNTFDIPGNKIKHLILQRSEIVELNANSFVGLVFLVDLDLSHNNIVMTRREIFEGVKKIELLNLNNNSIVILGPDGFAELENLKTLILSENKLLGILPNAFSGLGKLQHLDLRDNRISSASNVFRNLTKLQCLDLSDNLIHILENDTFIQLSSLLELRLSHNKIKTLIDAQFISTPNLNILGLSNNVIDTIEPHAFADLNSLEILDLGYNQLTEISRNILWPLHNVHELNLTGNHLNLFVTRRFAGLPKLMSLDMSHNDIEDIDVRGIFPLHELYSLDLSNNNLTDLDFVSLLHRIPSLSFLSLQNNYWPCDLEQEMSDYFEGENFKFVLFEGSNSVCYNNFVRLKKRVHLSNIQRGGSFQVFVYIPLLFLFCAVLALSFGQYRISRELDLNPLFRR